jgi:hypothetical protein
VAYNSKQRKAFTAKNVFAPETSSLSLIDRLGVISDSFAAGMAGYTSLVDSLELIEEFGNHETAGTFSVCF